MFVESYGRVAVQDSSFSPAGRRRARPGHRAAAGRRLLVAQRLPHLADLRRPQLAGALHAAVGGPGRRPAAATTSSSRPTASRSRGRSSAPGWRAVGAMPANHRAWPEGTAFYRYDKIYDRRNLGYRGPDFGLPPMPDQYTFLALQRRELARRHRPPLFAEVDLISSHAPWTKIPRLIPWDEVGDGSIFDRIPAEESTAGLAVRRRQAGPQRVRALDRVLAERALLVRAALRRRRHRARRPRRPPARDGRHRPGREPRRADLGHRPRPEGDATRSPDGAGRTACCRARRRRSGRWPRSATASSPRSARRP